MASLTASILSRASVCNAAARARQQPATTSRVAGADPIRWTTFLGRGAGQLSPLGRKVRARPPTDTPDERARAAREGDDIPRAAGRSLVVSPRRRRARRRPSSECPTTIFSREPLCARSLFAARRPRAREHPEDPPRRRRARTLRRVRCNSSDASPHFISTSPSRAQATVRARAGLVVEAFSLTDGMGRSRARRAARAPRGARANVRPKLDLLDGPSRRTGRPSVSASHAASRATRLREAKDPLLGVPDEIRDRAGPSAGRPTEFWRSTAARRRGDLSGATATPELAARRFLDDDLLESPGGRVRRGDARRAVRDAARGVHPANRGERADESAGNSERSSDSSPARPIAWDARNAPREATSARDEASENVVRRTTRERARRACSGSSPGREKDSDERDARVTRSRRIIRHAGAATTSNDA